MDKFDVRPGIVRLEKRGSNRDDSRIVITCMGVDAVDAFCESGVEDSEVLGVAAYSNIRLCTSQIPDIIE